MPMPGTGPVALASVGWLLAQPAVLVAQPSVLPYVVAADRWMGARAGAADLVTLQRAVAALEDRVLPPTRFDEPTIARRLVGIGYRAAKFLAVDLPQDHFLMVAAHELFGHGARLREIGAAPIGYQFDAPIPYGKGGGATRFALPPRTTRAERVSISTAGIEAQQVLAATLGERALALGTLHHRAAWLYLEARLAGLRYIRSVGAAARDSHDVAAFLRELREGCETPACRPIDARRLKRRALVMLADPLLAESAYGLLVSYAFQGRAHLRTPMIPLRPGIRYLPAFDFQMTPYGTEWVAAHHVLAGGRLTSVVFRRGDALARRTWAAGVTVTEALARRRLAATVAAAVWRQPRLDAPPAAAPIGTGGLAAATIRTPLGPVRLGRGTIGLVLHVGYKTEGFAPGEPLGAGAIVRAGLAYTPPAPPMR